MDPLVTSIPSANLCKVLHNFVDICIRKQKFAELTPVHPHDAIDATIRLRLDCSRIGSGSARIVARSFIDLGCRHLPCDVSHLLGDVVRGSPSLEPLELRIDVDGGEGQEPECRSFAYDRATKEDQSNATTAKAIRPVPTQPKPMSHGFALNRPIRRELRLLTIIMAMIGTATMPLRTALHTSM